MKKKVFSVLQYILFLGLAIFLVWWSLHSVDHANWLHVESAWSRADFWLLIPVILILLLSHLSRAARWRILMQPLGHRPSLINVFLAVLSSYILNLFVPRLGEVMKCTIINRYNKVPTDKLLGTVVAERAFDLVCLAIVFVITFLSQIDIIGGYTAELFDKIINNGTSPGRRILNWSIAIVAILAILITVRWLFKRFAHISIMQKIKEFIKNIWHGLNSIRYLKNKGWFIFHSVLIWVCYLAAIRVGMAAMKETSIYGIKESLSVLCMGSVGMIVAPGGIGAYPYAVQKTMLLYNMPEIMGLAFGWLLWGVQFFMVLFFGALSLVLLPIINREKTVVGSLTALKKQDEKP